MSKPSQVLSLVTNQNPLEMLHSQWPCSYGFVSKKAVLCPSSHSSGKILENPGEPPCLLQDQVSIKLEKKREGDKLSAIIVRNADYIGNFLFLRRGLDQSIVTPREDGEEAAQSTYRQNADAFQIHANSITLGLWAF